MTQALVSTGDLAAEFGLTQRTLRVYEARGLLVPERREPGSILSHRTYSEADRERLKTILEAKALGFTLAEIRDVLGQNGLSQEATKKALTRQKAEAQVAFLLARRRADGASLKRLRALLAAGDF